MLARRSQIGRGEFGKSEKNWRHSWIIDHSQTIRRDRNSVRSERGEG